MKYKFFTYILLVVMILSSISFAHARTIIIVKHKPANMDYILQQVPARFYVQQPRHFVYNYGMVCAGQQRANDINRARKIAKIQFNKKPSNQAQHNSNLDNADNSVEYSSDMSEGNFEAQGEFHFDHAQELRSRINNGDFEGRERANQVKNMIDSYKTAVNLNYAPAMTELGVVYSVDTYGVKDSEKAFQYFQKGAKGGDLTALYYVGRCYLNGEGTKKDEKLALKAFKEGCERGDLDCQVKLGLCHYNGWGTKKDYAKAVENLEAVINSPDNDYVSKSNLGDAHFTLYKIYDEGGHGVEKDFGKRSENLQKAAEYGNDAANNIVNYDPTIKSEAKPEVNKENKESDKKDKKGKKDKKEKKDKKNKKDKKDKKDPDKDGYEINPATGNYKSGTSEPINKGEE